MEISDEKVREFQAIFKKNYGKELSMDEARESARNLLGLLEIAYDHVVEEHVREQKLKDHPKGFHLDDGKTYTCRICRTNISDEKTWWDKNGIKCLSCQNAINKKLIPRSVCKNDDFWYALWEFEYYFGIKSPTIRKFVREGKLHSRVVPDQAGKKHFELFLVKDNEGILPKKPKSRVVHGENDMVHIEYEPVTLPDFMEEVRKKKSEKG